MVEINQDEFEQFAKEKFPDKITCYEKNFIFIQAGNCFGDELHYEYCEDKMQLHIEGRNWRGIRDFLRNSDLRNTGKVYSSWWGRNDCAWTLLNTKLSDWEKVKEAFITIDSIINPYIQEFEGHSVQAQSTTGQNVEEYFEDTAIKDNLSLDPGVNLYSRSLGQIMMLTLAIPNYQRIYCWEDKQVSDLWDNLLEMPNKEYHLGAIILHFKKDEEKYNIIDGQQRLVTLAIILNELNVKTPLLKHQFLSKSANDHIANTKELVKHLSQELKKDNQKKENFLKKIINNLMFSVLVLNEGNLDLAYTFFSNQNSKGVPLSDYDLLKAHHLRYIYIEEEQEHLARQWNNKTKDEKGIQSLSCVLGTHLYRLRNWMRKRNFDENKRLCVKEEFSAAPIIRGIPPFGERFQYYEKIQGGAHFFTYTNHFLELYQVFSKTEQVKLLCEHLQYKTHYRYGSVIETLLFAYYLKFGNQYLSEALFCIAGVMAQHRYTVGRAIMHKIREYASNSEIVMMIDQATSPTFFLAESLSLIKISGQNKNENYGIKEDFFQSLKRIFNKLDDFTDKTIANKKEQEYGKQ